MKRSRNRRGILIPLIIILSLGSILFWFLKENGLFLVSEQTISPLANNNTDRNFLSFIDRFIKPKLKPDFSTLIKNIKSITDKQTGVYSVYVVDLNSNQSSGFGETTIFTAASINKLPILAVLYHEAQQGVIDLDERITIQPDDIQDYGTGIIRDDGPGGVYSIKTLAQLMMEKSDNTAAYILVQRLGESRVQELTDSWGLTQTDIANNKTSNKDMATLLTKIYLGQITNKAQTAELLGFMLNSDFENRLPALLPKDVKVYHKVGTGVGNIHDVGIVKTVNITYYIGIFTNDITGDTQTENALAQISQTAYQFMINR